VRASADLRIRSNRSNLVPQHGEKSTTGRIYKDLGEKKLQYLIDLALNVKRDHTHMPPTPPLRYHYSSSPPVKTI